MSVTALTKAPKLLLTCKRKALLQCLVIGIDYSDRNLCLLSRNKSDSETLVILLAKRSRFTCSEPTI